VYSVCSNVQFGEGVILMGSIVMREAPEMPARDPQGFSVEFYRPMERLLLAEDEEFLRRQPGFEPSMLRSLRSERRRVFRSYLRLMAQDFRRLHRSVRILLRDAPEDQPELAGAAFRQALLFRWGMLSVHARLTLHAAGLGTVPVTGLIQSLERMSRLAPVSASASA